MNRFTHSAPSAGAKLAAWLPVAVFLLLLALFLGGIGNLSESTAAKQEESLRTALDRSIAQCYAVEGSYPPDLDYLRAHYGLTYDEEQFFVDYVSYGSNLRPEVTVLPRKR